MDRNTNQFMQDWQPEKDPAAFPGLPSGIVLNAVNSFKKAANEIQRGIQRAERRLQASVPTFSPPIGRDDLMLIVLLSRSERNRGMLEHHDIATPLIRLLKMATTKLSLMTSSRGLQGGDSTAKEGLVEYLQNIIALCLKVVVNMTDSNGSWRHVLALASQGNNDGISRSAIGHGASTSMLSQGIIGIATDIIRVSRMLYALNSGNLSRYQYEIQALSLETIGSIILRVGSPAQIKLRETGGLEILISMIGWPLGTTGLDPPRLDMTRAMREHAVQMSCLSVICIGADSSPENARRITALGGLDRLVDLILWYAVQFSESKAGSRPVPDCDISIYDDVVSFKSDPCLDSCDGISYNLKRVYVYGTTSHLNPPNIPTSPLSTELQYLFSLLHAFCLTGGPKNRGHFYGVNTGALQVLLNVFDNGTRHTPNNSAARKYICTLPEIQVHMTRLLTRLLTVHPKPIVDQILNHFRLFNVWNVLLGDFFFVGGQKIGELEESSITAAGEKQESVLKAAWFFARSAKLYKCIKKNVLELVQHVATALSTNEKGSSGNLKECGRLFELFKAYGNDAQTLCEIGYSIRVIMEKDWNMTLESMLKLDILPILNNIANNHRLEHDSFCVKCLGSDFLVGSTKSISRPTEPLNDVGSALLFHKARGIVLFLINNILQSDAIAALAGKNSELVDSLFILMFEPATRQFSVRQLCQVMQMSSPDSKESLALFKRYLELIAIVSQRARDSDAHYDLLLSLIAGIRTVLLHNTKHHQRTFRELGAFVKIITVLNTEIPGTTTNTVEDRRSVFRDVTDDCTTLSKGQRLLFEVLRTLPSLLAHSYKSKASFRDDIGFDHLTTLIIRAEGGKPSSRTMDLLFDLLVDGRYLPEEESYDITDHGPSLHNDRKRVAIRNADVIQSIFGLVPLCEPRLARRVLEEFTLLVNMYSVNLSYSCSVGLIGLLLDMVPRAAEVKEESEHTFLELLLHLVETLGLHSISVKELKILFSLLREKKDGTRPSFSSALLHAVQYMTRRQGPEVFFDFDGRHSALIIPRLDSWPPPRGYTFATWLRVESFTDPEGKPLYEPRLYSFLTEDAQGMECYFNSTQNLVMQTTVKRNVLTVPFSFKFESKKWYSVCIVHSLARWPVGGQEAKLFIDGVQVDRISIKYPAIVGVPVAPPLTKCRIGSSYEFTGGDSSADIDGMVSVGVSKARYREMPLFGQLGSVYVFSEAFSPAQVLGLFSLGPNYLDVFHPSEIHDMTPTAAEILFDGTIMSSLHLAYNSKACEGRFCLDNSPVENGHLPVHARLAGMTPSVTRDARDTIFCLGGVSVLFPLLTQLDLPISGSDKEVSKPETQLSFSVLSLLIEMIRESRTNQAEMLRCYGFDIVTHLLMQVDSEHITPSCIGLFADLAAFVFEKKQFAVYRAIFESVFLNFQLFARSSFESLLSWATHLGDIAMLDRKYFRDELCGVQHLLDILRLFLWYDPQAAITDGYSNSLFGLSKNALRIPQDTESKSQEDKFSYPRLATKKLHEVRWAVLDTIGLVTDGKPDRSEMKAILLFLEQCGDMRQKEDILCMLLSLMRSEGSSKSHVATTVAALDGTRTILSLLGSTSEPVREATIACLAAMVEGCGSYKGLLPLNNNVGAALLAENLNQFPLTPRIYDALLAFALGREPAITETDERDPELISEVLSHHSYSDFSAAEVADIHKKKRRGYATIERRRGRPLFSQAAGLDFNQNLDMKYPSVALTILKLIQVHGTSIQLRLRALQDMLLLLTHSNLNRIQLASLEGWERILFDVMGAQDADMPEGSRREKRSTLRIPEKSVRRKSRPTTKKISELLSAQEEYRSIAKFVSLDVAAVHDLVMRVHQLLHLGILEEEREAYLQLEDALIGAQLFMSTKENLDGGAAARRILVDQATGLRSAFDHLVEKEKISKTKSPIRKGKSGESTMNFMAAREALRKGPVLAVKVPAIYENTAQLLIMMGENILFRVDHSQASLNTDNTTTIAPIVTVAGLRKDENGEWMDLSMAVEALRLIEVAGLNELCNVISSSERSLGSSRVEKTIAKIACAVLAEEWDHKENLELASRMIQDLLLRLTNKPTSEWDQFVQDALPFVLWELSKSLGIANESESSEIDGEHYEIVSPVEEDSNLPPRSAKNTSTGPTWKGLVRAQTERQLGEGELVGGVEQPAWRVQVLVTLFRRILRSHKPALSMILIDAEGEPVVTGIPNDSPILRLDSSPEEFLESVAGDFRWRYAIRRGLPAACSVLLRDDAPRGPIATALGVRWTLASADIKSKHEKSEENESNQLSNIMGPLEEAHRRRCFEELHRVQETALVFYRQHRRTATRQWRRVLRVLTTERGVWGSRLTDDQVYWKLDHHEDHARRRKRFKRNLLFDNHSTASRLRDSSRPSNEPEKKVPRIALKPEQIVDDGEDIEQDENEEDWDIVQAEADIITTNPGIIAGPTEGKEKEVKEKLVFGRTYCELITPLRVVPGWLEITTRYVYFYARQPDEEAPEGQSNALLAESAASDWTDRHGKGAAQQPPKDRKWGLEEIREIHPRRYLLRPSAIELFLTDRSNHFLNFHRKSRNKVFDKIIGLDCPNMVQTARTRSPQQWLRKSGLSRRWQHREISNFEYLMHLNTIAGRTYNDLTQYPVFPWVIADYTSETLDLNDPKTYRDLSKPIGALDEKRLAEVLERYDIWDDPVIPKFMYGSHYSSAGIVLYYLIRVEPFTTLFLQLQGGRFDHADRMFSDVAHTWRNCLHGTGDVREIIPEWYYLPEMFCNLNNFDLGKKQDGTSIADVTLPPWANGSPEEFVRINAQALESEYVSEHLNEWIDLVFGFKQKGRNAVGAHNVFYYLTYEGSVDIDSIEDPQMRMATISQIHNFGQTPTQLISRRAHPKRMGKGALVVKHPTVFSNPGAVRAFFLQISSAPLVFVGTLPTHEIMSLLYMGIQDRIVTFDRQRVLAAHRWQPGFANAQGTPFTFGFDPSMTNRPGIGVSFAPGVSPGHHCVAMTPDGRCLISCGYWDNTFKLHLVESSRLSQSIRAHKDTVTCLALSNDGSVLVTGSRDTTCMVWDIALQSGIARAERTPRAILYGHDDEVTAVAVDTEHDLVVSVSLDGTCIIHALKHTRYIRSIPHPNGKAFHLCAISVDGYILTYSLDDLSLRLFTLNGKLCATADTQGRLSGLSISPGGEYAVTGGETGLCIVHRMRDLRVVHKYNVEMPLHCVIVTSDETHILAGTHDGKLLVFAFPSS